MFGTELKLGTKLIRPYAYCSLDKGVAYTRGGGYLKSDGARLHTFNTRSGMCRKLGALGICPAAILDPTSGFAS